MGIYDAGDRVDSLEVETDFHERRKVGGYIAYHARKQLAFDVWWLALALFVSKCSSRYLPVSRVYGTLTLAWPVCIIERHSISDPSTDTWFNEFTVVFEIISAYGTVGLSLGTPVASCIAVGRSQKG
jgi:hypothetical protein